AACACFAQAPSRTGGSKLTKRQFGKTAGGAAVDLYTLRNDRGMQVAITTYGGAVVSLTAPDRAGKMADVVLGCDNVAGYEHQTAYLGALIGRYGNRIGGA